jgi:uncharacterized protein YjbJ (UPF0337 family)
MVLGGSHFPWADVRGNIHIPSGTPLVSLENPLLRFCHQVDGESNRTKTKSSMNTLGIKGDWNIIKGRLRQKWASLTEDDLQYAEGQQEEMLGRIQKRTGASREAIQKVIHGACPSYGF